MDRKEKNQENELYFPDYLKAVKEDENPESIDFKGSDISEEETRQYQSEPQNVKQEDYDGRYLHEDSE